MTLIDEIQNAAESGIADKNICDEFLIRLKEGNLTRDENPQSHFCTYFLPYNPKTKKVFLVDHKKAKTWISPGGHIDKGERLLETLNREIWEELGVQNFFSESPKPFLLTIKPIDNQVQTCKKHFDIWFLVEIDGKNFKVDPEEFNSTKWISLTEAKNLVTDITNLQALNILAN